MQLMTRPQLIHPKVGRIAVQMAILPHGTGFPAPLGTLPNLLFLVKQGRTSYAEPCHGLDSHILARQALHMNMTHWPTVL